MSHLLLLLLLLLTSPSTVAITQSMRLHVQVAVHLQYPLLPSPVHKHLDLTLSLLRRGPAHPLSRPHAAALCGWRGARARAACGLWVAVPSPNIVPASITDPLLFCSCRPNSEPTSRYNRPTERYSLLLNMLHSQNAGLPSSCSPLLLLLRLVHVQSKSCTSRYIHADTTT